MCVNDNVYDFTYLYRYIATFIPSCTCIRAWLLHALSKQYKAIVRERAYSDSICTTPWGLASLACVFREIGSSSLSEDFHCARAVRRLLKVTKSEKCTVRLTKRLESAIFHILVNISAILHPIHSI